MNICVRLFYTLHTQTLAVHPQLLQLSPVSLEVTTKSSMDITGASLWEGVMEEAMFPLYSPVPHLSSTWSWGHSCQSGGLITNGKKTFVNIKKHVKSTGAINGVFQFHPFAIFFIITGVHWTSSTKATFCKSVLNYCRHDGFLCHRNIMHDNQNVQFSYVFCRLILIPCNKKCNTCLQHSHVIQFMMPWSSGSM